ncbi:MAG TPA: hypothetical protein VHB98_14300 [Chloroflexota bacterium]|nr:hypothetical protein [Chloroflexota bacterium]
MARRKPVKPFPYFVAQGQNPINTLPARSEPVPVARVVGSVSKAHRLTPTFLPKEQKMRSRRFHSVRQAMRRGVTLPPIEVYGLRREYYVIDGHNRVAAAIADGIHYLDATILECLLPERSLEDQLANARMHFERRTGLRRIQLSDPASYPRVLAEIRQYRDALQVTEPEITVREAAQRWYHAVFVPIAEPLDLGATALAFEGKTVCDLYLVVCEHLQALEQKRGTPVSAAEAVADFQARFPSPLAGRVLRPLQRRARRAVWRVTGGPPVI